MKLRIITRDPFNVSSGEGQRVTVIKLNQTQRIVKINRAVKGLKGPPGPAGGEAVIELPAGENVSSGRAVIKSNGKVYYFNPNDLTHIGRTIGITRTSGLINEAVEVVYGGLVTDAAFSFEVDKPLYVGLNGQLFSTVQDVLVVQKLAVSIETNKILIDFFSPVIKQ